MSLNVFSAIGRVGKDAQVRSTQAGKQVAGWSLAVDHGWGDRKETIWLDCSLWGDRGAKVAEYITKGSQLGVTGEIGTREHEGRTYLTLNVRDVTLVGGRNDSQESRSAEPARDDDMNDEVPF